MKQLLFLFILILAIVVVGCSSENALEFEEKNEEKVTIFKSVTCGCCSNYANYMKKNGFEVETINTANMDVIKAKYSIPRNMESCHTTVIEGYFVEGHVPIEAVNKLLEEKPDIAGIALPGMPAGSPGMPGMKREEWKIYSVSNGKMSEFMII